MPNVSGDNDEDIIKDFGTDLKPSIEAKYSVAQGRHNTAVAGYGLGGRIALCIGLSLPEQVAYTGHLLQLPAYFHMMEEMVTSIMQVFVFGKNIRKQALL